MALTVSVVDRNVVGAARMNVVDVTFDNSYPTGGEALSAAACGLNRMLVVVPTNAPGQFIEWDGTNLVLYDEAGVEEINASDQSGVSTRLIVYGE